MRHMKKPQLHFGEVNIADIHIEAGARREQVSQTLGLSVRTLQRWVDDDKVKEDQRPLIARPAPNNKLSEAERSPTSRSLQPA